MSAITSSSHGSRSAAHRDYRVLVGLTTPLFVAGVALRRLSRIAWVVPRNPASLPLQIEQGSVGLPMEPCLGLLPAEPVRPASFIAAVRTRAAAVIPFAFMG